MLLAKIVVYIYLGLGLEHVHPAAERQALEKGFEGLQACN